MVKEDPLVTVEEKCATAAMKGLGVVEEFVALKDRHGLCVCVCV